MAVAAQIPPPPIISKDKNDVGTFRRFPKFHTKQCDKQK
jgi:hypothetical protein